MVVDALRFLGKEGEPLSWDSPGSPRTSRSSSPHCVFHMEVVSQRVTALVTHMAEHHQAFQNWCLSQDSDDPFHIEIGRNTVEFRASTGRPFIASLQEAGQQDLLTIINAYWQDHRSRCICRQSPSPALSDSQATVSSNCSAEQPGAPKRLIPTSKKGARLPLTPIRDPNNVPHFPTPRMETPDFLRQLVSTPERLAARVRALDTPRIADQENLSPLHFSLDLDNAPSPENAPQPQTAAAANAPLHSHLPDRPLNLLAISRFSSVYLGQLRQSHGFIASDATVGQIAVLGKFLRWDVSLLGLFQKSRLSGEFYEIPFGVEYNGDAIAHPVYPLSTQWGYGKRDQRGSMINPQLIPAATDGENRQPLSLVTEELEAIRHKVLPYLLGPKEYLKLEQIPRILGDLNRDDKLDFLTKQRFMAHQIVGAKYLLQRVARAYQEKIGSGLPQDLQEAKRQVEEKEAVLLEICDAIIKNYQQPRLFSNHFHPDVRHQLEGAQQELINSPLIKQAIQETVAEMVSLGLNPYQSPSPQAGAQREAPLPAVAAAAAAPRRSPPRKKSEKKDKENMPPRTASSPSVLKERQPR